MLYMYILCNMKYRRINFPWIHYVTLPLKLSTKSLAYCTCMYSAIAVHACSSDQSTIYCLELSTWTFYMNIVYTCTVYSMYRANISTVNHCHGTVQCAC